MKHLFSKLAVIGAFFTAAALSATSCSCNPNHQDENKDCTDSTSIVTNMHKTVIEEPVFDIITNKGTIRVKLYSKTPLHRENFRKLVAEHFYDSILFHRVIDGFMIQAGDPYTKDTSKVELYGQGGPGYTVPAEFVNEYYHKKGALAAARRGDMANPKKASSGSQFYIVQDENACLHLDGQYTIFGETVDGFDVIDRIAKVPVDRMDRPLEDVRIITIKEVLPEPEAEVKQAEDTVKVQ
ncbi:MAG: peptidylprolyl isomerase [Candidatus Cryptobacteroides sp.]|nr:peptidylprolyl isomerase [Candidatus Cryptobacteroides sp.]